MSADLSAIRARLAAGEPRLVALIQGGRRWGLNAMHSLIAHAPADIAALADEVESLRAAVERVRALAEAWRKGYGPGSRVEGIMGRQVVTIEHAVESVTEALDGTP